MLSPIALFVYNRPWHTRQTVEALANNHLADKSDLIIFSDGPRNKEDETDVGEVREYIKSINGFKSVSVIRNEDNAGLANSIISGVTKVVGEYGKIIVVEDDLITSPFFIEYMNTAFDLYQDTQEVMEISGYMFPIENGAEDNALFLPLTSSWGWGTWRRAWEHFDPDMKEIEALRNDEALKRKFNIDGACNYYGMLENQSLGKTDSWVIRWYLNVFMNNGLTLFPRRSLVDNIGFDGTGVHCKAGDDGFKVNVDNKIRINTFPKSITVDEDCFNNFREMMSKKRKKKSVSIKNRIMRLFK